VVEEPRDEASSVAPQLADALNRHGYGFQQAVAERVTTLEGLRKTRWWVSATEFPVSVGETVSHIDLVLQAGQDDAYLVCECKRADPAIARWCFARAPIRGDDRLRENPLVLEDYAQTTQKLVFSPLIASWSTEPFNIAVELKQPGQKGDGVGGARDAINAAITQAFRGTNGLARHFAAGDWASLKDRKIRIIPAVFTTAELWITNHDLRLADLDRGHIDPDKVSAEPVGWIWYNYNLSPHLRHDIPSSAPRPTILADFLLSQSTRSVAIVSPPGLEDFLAKGIV
jgi:hypothetical protein